MTRRMVSSFQDGLDHRFDTGQMGTLSDEDMLVPSDPVVDSSKTCRLLRGLVSICVIWT